jgi:5'-3' exonuclease
VEDGVLFIYLFLGGMLTRSQAPGEAEAELAYLNRVGVIDGILSDDVDNFLFGATLVIRKQVSLPPISNLF